MKYDSRSQKITSIILTTAYQFVADFVAQTLCSEFPDLCEKIGAEGTMHLFPGTKLKCLIFDGESDPYTQAIIVFALGSDYWPGGVKGVRPGTIGDWKQEWQRILDSNGEKSLEE